MSAKTFLGMPITRRDAAAQVQEDREARLRIQILELQREKLKREIEQYDREEKACEADKKASDFEGQGRPAR